MSKSKVNYKSYSTKHANKLMKLQRYLAMFLREASESIKSIPSYALSHENSRMARDPFCKRERENRAKKNIIKAI